MRDVLLSLSLLLVAVGGCRVHASIETLWDTPDPTSSLAGVMLMMHEDSVDGTGGNYRILTGTRSFGVELGTDVGFHPVELALGCSPPAPLGYHVDVAAPVLRGGRFLPLRWNITFTGFRGFSGRCEIHIAVADSRRGRMIDVASTFVVESDP